AAEQRQYELLTKQSRGETEPVPLETGKPPAKSGGGHEQMRFNPAKGIGFVPLEAAEKIKVPVLIVMAEKDEIVDNKQSGEKLHEILKANKIPTAIHTIKEIAHYGIYKEGFEESSKLAVDWFRKHLMPEK